MSQTHLSGSRFVRGRCVEHHRDGGGPAGVASAYMLEDAAGERHVCDYTDIVSDGFRTLEVGDQVRYEATSDVVQGDLRKARHVIRLVDHSRLLYQELQPPRA